jgi:hypothetical protein
MSIGCRIWHLACIYIESTSNTLPFPFPVPNNPHHTLLKKSVPGVLKGERSQKIMSKKIALFLLPLLLISFLAGPPRVFGAIGSVIVTKSPVPPCRGEDISMILKVLESKMGNQKIPQKALDKLVSLSDEQFGLISSLSERIADNTQTVGADVAFLLITAILVWS